MKFQPGDRMGLLLEESVEVDRKESVSVCALKNGEMVSNCLFTL